MEKPTVHRRGHAIWLSESDGPVLRAVAEAEDRPITNVLSRAVRAYAERSADYQELLAKTASVLPSAAPEAPKPKRSKGA